MPSKLRSRRLAQPLCILLFLSGCGDAAAPTDTMAMDGAMDGAMDATQLADATSPADASVDATPDATPEPPTGPIPPPEGTDTTPEEEAFTWRGVSTRDLSRRIPSAPIDWSTSPRYGVAELLTTSESDECVCFDLECDTCNRDECGAELCTYDLNPSHTLTKYHVELRSLADDAHAIRFEVNVSANPPISYTTISDVLSRLERIPVEYWYGLKVITQFGRGIQFLHESYFSGAAAYGSMTYIDTQTAELPTLLHELGHTFEQYTRIGNPPALEPQSNILNPVWRHAIRSDNNRTSRYGDNNEWEDMAEFARIYAMSMVEGSRSTLQELSPERYRIWERILWNGATIAD